MKINPSPCITATTRAASEDDNTLDDGFKPFSCLGPFGNVKNYLRDLCAPPPYFTSKRSANSQSSPTTSPLKLLLLTFLCFASITFHSSNIPLVSAAHHDHRQHVSEPLQSRDRDMQMSELQIIGGTIARRNKFDFFVAAPHGACGGTLIAPDVVLSAAHCYSYFEEFATVGEYKFGSLAYGAEKIRVKKRVVHPKNVARSFKKWDLMLVFLERPSQKEPIPFHKLNKDRHNPRTNQLLVSVGMGTKHPVVPAEYKPPKFLNKVTLRAAPMQVCVARSPSFPRFPVHGGSTFCAFGASKKNLKRLTNKTTCVGDSGGPVLDKAGRLVGVVSWGSIPCVNTAGFYARVSSSVPWIKAQLKRFNRKKRKTNRLAELSRGGSSENHAQTPVGSNFTKNNPSV